MTAFEILTSNRFTSWKMVFWTIGGVYGIVIFMLLFIIISTAIVQPQLINKKTWKGVVGYILIITTFILLLELTPTIIYLLSK